MKPARTSNQSVVAVIKPLNSLIALAFSDGKGCHAFYKVALPLGL